MNVKPSKSPTSIKARLDRASRALTLIAAASSSESSMSAGEVLRAINPIALDAADELYWLSLLPAEVTDLPAPTDDEASAGFVGRFRGVDDADGGRRQLIEAALRALTAEAQPERRCTMKARSKVPTNASDANSQPRPSASRDYMEFLDDIQVRLREQEAVARMLAAVFRACDAARPGGIEASEIDHLWSGLAVIADRLERELDAVEVAVGTCHELVIEERRVTRNGGVQTSARGKGGA